MSSPTRYVKGEWKAVCDVCGRRFDSSKLRKRWDGLMVCNQDFEERHPQDFVRAREDIQAVPWSRPEAADSFVLFCTPNGSSGVSDYAVADCAVAERDLAWWDDEDSGRECTSIYVLVPTTVSDTQWACTSLVVDDILTLDGVIGVY